MFASGLFLALQQSERTQALVIGLVIYVILVVSLSFHEFGHAWCAYKLGDSTAKDLGRLTLNPLPHLHPIFTVALPLYFLLGPVLLGSAGGPMLGTGVFFAAARPVPVVAQNLRSPVRDMMLTSIAGPAMNVVLAFFFTACYWLHVGVRHIPTEELSSLLIMHMIQMNLGLAIFNMLPIPPLDGHRVVSFFLPPSLRRGYESIGIFGIVLILVLLRDRHSFLSHALSQDGPIFGFVAQVWKYFMPEQMLIFGTGV